MTTSIYDLTGNTKDFAESIYYDSSARELVERLTSDSYKTDCKNWKISRKQFVEAVTTAIAEKIEEMEGELAAANSG